MSAAPLLLLGLLGATTSSPWQPLVPGLELRSERTAVLATEALRVDPRQVRIRVVLARDLGPRGATVHDLAEATGALAVVNGGFFDPELRPVGLRVSGGQRIAGGRRDSLGALAVLGDRVAVVSGEEIAGLGAVDELVQCGPRLVVHGKLNRLKPQVSRRTAAGIDAEGRLVVLVTREGFLEARELAALLAAPEAAGGYALVEALNLDGGGSTQLYASAGGRTIHVPGATAVADAIVFLPRGSAADHAPGRSARYESARQEPRRLLRPSLIRGSAGSAGQLPRTQGGQRPPVAATP